MVISQADIVIAIANAAGLTGLSSESEEGRNEKLTLDLSMSTCS